MVNLTALRMAYKSKGFTQELLAKELGITTAAFNKKMAGSRRFSIDDAQQLSEILNLRTREILAIFFNRAGT